MHPTAAVTMLHPQFRRQLWLLWERWNLCPPAEHIKLSIFSISKKLPLATTGPLTTHWMPSLSQMILEQWTKHCPHNFPVATFPLPFCCWQFQHSTRTTTARKEPLWLTQFCKLTSTPGIMKLRSLCAANKSPQTLLSVKWRWPFQTPYILCHAQSHPALSETEPREAAMRAWSLHCPGLKISFSLFLICCYHILKS